MAVLYSKSGNNNMNDEDSDDGPIQRQALPVNTNLEIDETRPASTAEEYLLRVRFQRQKLPKISYAQIKIDKKKLSKDKIKIANTKKSKYFNNYNKYFEESKEKQNINPLLLPNDEWKNKFVNSFKLKRDCLMQNFVKQSKWSKKHKNLNNTQYLQYKHLNIPASMNSAKWLKFALNHTDKYSDNELTIIDYLNPCAKIEDNCNANDIDNVFPVPPLLTIIEQLSPIETEKVLQTFMDFVIETHENETDYGLNGIASLWIYALFLRIEFPLSANLTANIRQFARFCVKQRNKLKEDESSALIVLTNIFIVLIEEVFKQPIT